MNIDDLADLLKSRNCDAVSYFHTDHFEPWSASIDDASAHAVERMARMARSSPYARKLSLFYSVFVPYRLNTSHAIDGDDQGIAGDGVVFGVRSARQETLARDAIRPLVTVDDHELHLHVHHEFWTRNASHFDHPVSRWVNAHSTTDADRARLDLHFKLCKEAISREIGLPFERWAFVHGNWALNASDPLICQVTNEMAIIMRHGGFGDFSFPAGRSYCDPKLEGPFTCLPLDLPRAYDDPRADPRPVDIATGVMRPERFLIWNSPIKSVHSSLDYYSAANRKLFSDPERVVANWLGKSVCLGRNLLIKTHAHSMKTDYNLVDPAALIPHTYPDVIRIFDCLARACDRARVDLQFHTVNEVVSFLDALDAGRAIPRPPMSARSLAPIGGAVASTSTWSRSALNAAAPETIVAETTPLTAEPEIVIKELISLHRQWIEITNATAPRDELYEAKLAQHTPLERYELAIAAEMAERYPADATRVIEIGSGWGGLAVLLARQGFEVLGFECNARRYAACRWHFEEEVRRFPRLASRLSLAPLGLFPDVISDASTSRSKLNLGIVTNITSTYSAERQGAILQAATAFDELIIDLSRFGEARDSQDDRDALFRTIVANSFKPVERLFFQTPYEYWLFRNLSSRSRADLSTGKAISPHASVIVADAAEATLVPAASAPPPQPSGKADANKSVPLTGRRGTLFTVFGDNHLGQCPVCHSTSIADLWRMPMANLKKPIEVFGGYFNQIPTLQVPATIFCFDICSDCESIFLNPVPSQQKDSYRTTDHYIRKMENETEWKGYEDVYDSFAPWIPNNASVMIDAACGIGQYLQIARKREPRLKRLIGLELSEKYVAHMRTEGLEAYTFDIDNEDLLPLVAPNSVDFVSFSEAFEHVDRPLDALRKLLAVLRPGGRLYFTAQRYGEDVQAAVRPGEPIYIGEKVVRELPQRIGCQIVNMTTSGMRYHLVLEK